MASVEQLEVAGDVMVYSSCCFLVRVVEVACTLPPRVNILGSVALSTRYVLSRPSLFLVRFDRT